MPGVSLPCPVAIGMAEAPHDAGRQLTRRILVAAGLPKPAMLHEPVLVYTCVCFRIREESMGQHLDSAEEIQRVIDRHVVSKARKPWVWHAVAMSATCVTSSTPSTCCLSGALLGPHQPVAARRATTSVGCGPTGCCLLSAGSPCQLTLVDDCYVFRVTIWLHCVD
jgi:hypothetical protein